MAKEKKDTNKQKSKRVKITLKDIMPSGFKKMKPVDMTKIQEEDKKKVEADKIRYEKETEEEKNRFENLPCPVCKNTKKEKVHITHMDGPLIVGGRNAVNTLAKYCVCQSCGCMFVDLKEKKVNPPYQGMFARPSHFPYWD